MLTRLIRTGDSRGVRIPAALLEQTGHNEEAKVPAEWDQLVQAKRTIGRRWEEALASLAERVDDAALLGEIPDLPLWNG